MRLVDFLIHILKAQADALTALNALFGETVLTEILERAGDGERRKEPRALQLKMTGNSTGIEAVAYAELEDAVEKIRLPATLKFYLWSYPPYRALIESPLELMDTIDTDGPFVDFVDEAIEQARVWVHGLGLPEPYSKSAERAIEGAWKQFRTAVLKDIGRRTLTRVR